MRHKKSTWVLAGFSCLIIAFVVFYCSQMQGQTKENNSFQNPYYSEVDTQKLQHTRAEWKRILPDSIYEIAFESGTETAFSGKYWNYTSVGTYYCAVCGNKLFRSTAKFASSCGWPSFFEPSRRNSVRYEKDNRFGMERTEVLCARCGAHLGHVFDDGPPPTGLRYCMNSVVLNFSPERK